MAEVPEGPADFGDAPDPSFPSRLTSDGLRFIDPSQIWLGSLNLPGATLEDDALIIDRDAQDDGLIGLREELGKIYLTFQLTRSQQAQAGRVWFNLWADINNDGSWQGFILPQPCITPSSNVDPLPQPCGIGEWIITNQGIWIYPGETVQFEAEFNQYRGNLEHWIRASVSDEIILITYPFIKGRYPRGEVEDYHLVPPYILPNRQNPTPTLTPTLMPSLTPHPTGTYIITEDGFRVTYTGPLEVPTGGRLEAIFQIITPDGLLAKGTLNASLGDPPSDQRASHASGELDKEGKVTLFFDVNWPAGITKLYISHEGKIYAITEITINP